MVAERLTNFVVVARTLNALSIKGKECAGRVFHRHGADEEVEGWVAVTCPRSLYQSLS